jgi:hypothetical protein
MWMESFDLSNLVDKESIGLNESRCALVYNEKTGLFIKLLGMMEEFGEPADFGDDDLFEMMKGTMQDTSGHRLPSSRGKLKAVPSSSKRKRQTGSGQ